MNKHPSSKIREINFNYLLAGLIVLMLAIPLLYGYTSLDHPELFEIVFGSALVLGVVSLTSDMREFMAGLIVALSALVCAAVSAFSGLSLFRYLTLEAVVGVFYIAILVAALVGDFMAARKTEN